MWNIANRDIIVLVSVISGCAIICNVWGSFFALTITLVLIICAWCTYIVADDTPFTPHALLALDYLEQAGRELNSLLERSYRQIFGYSARIRNILLYLYETHIVDRMAQRRRSSYQLSAETYTNSRNTSRFNLVDGLSPIARGSYRPPSGSNVENSPYSESDSRIFEPVSSLGQVTSTPLVSWKKEGTRNGNIFGSDPSGINKVPWKNSQSLSQNHTLSRGEDITYSTEGSPWGTSISPKMRERAGGIKTVQTVAGPLLASTRYNIDPKVYSDVTSAGLTTRLAKYATEANMKLTHQPQYGTGQFPRVNLNSSPAPLMNMKTGKIRMPVTVRVAPPESTRYSSPERQQILSNICHAESKAQPSVVQVLREISLKRHASYEDVTFDVPKKQRTEPVFSDGLENLEEMTQKRSRDESSRSEEEISPQSKAIRPAKRTKMPSCYDILSSLSSSINVSSGVKRKAVDVSRSGTPDVGKHFKALDTSHGDGIGMSPLSRSISEPMKPNKRILNQPLHNTELQSSHTKSVESIPQKRIVTTSTGREILNNAGGDTREKNRDVPRHDPTIARERVTKLPSPSDKLTDKLFMKAEPQNIDKLKTLIEEHGNMTPRFTTNDTDEIKKSDIVNMRQTSMKTRLKSMFDAISGKATSKINPDVVIQAEEPKVSSSQTIVASLSSSTSTTNVNTSPIATSAIVPIIGKTKPNTTPMKHVTFQFTSAETLVKPSIVETTKVTIAETKTTSSSNASQEPKKVDNPVVEKSASTIFQTPISSSPTSIFTPSSVPAFSIASPTFATSSSISTNPIPTTIPKSSTFTSSPTKLVTTVTTSPSQFNSTQLYNPVTTSSTLFGAISPAMSKSVSNLQNMNSTAQSPEKNSQTPSVNFSFGTLGNTNLATPKSIQNNQNTLLPTTQTVTTSAPLPISTVSSGLFGFGAVTKPVQSDTTTNAFNPPASTSFSFGGNVATPQATEKKTFTFGTTAATTANESAGTISTITSQSTPVSVVATTGSGFNFSSSNNTPTTTNLFGTPTTTSSIPSSGFLPSTSATPVFTFGTNLSSTATSKPGFSFGTNPTTTAVATTSASSVPSLSFGNTNNVAIRTFGGSSTTSSSTSVSTQPTIFGAPVTTAAGFATSTNSPAFGTTGSQPPTFAASSATASTFGTPKTMETPAFGTNTSGLPSFPVTSTTSGIFSGVNTEVTTTSALPAFGTRSFGQMKPPPEFGNPSFGSTGSPSLFGAPPTTTVAFGASNTSIATPIFGTPSTLTPSFATSSTPALVFGNANTPAPSFGTQSTPASSFGTQNAPVLSFGTPSTAPPAFGATNSSTTSFGTVSTAAPAFGTINTTTSTFGAQNSATGTIGNPISTSSTFSATTPAFGVATKAPPAFPTSLPTPGAFGTPSTSGFGSVVATPSNPPPAFTSSNSSFPGFGANSNVASPFSTQPTASSSNYSALNTGNSSFGSTVNTGNTNFTFNSSQVPVQQPQQNAVFAFGSGAATPASNVAGGSSPFQFSSVAPQSGGFNFTGAPTTPAINFSKDGTAGNSFNLPATGTNAFNAPATGGMFSIGTGSTAPRSRPSRRRQR